MRKRIGEFLLERGFITEQQRNAILAHGNREGLRFGEAGIDLGIFTEEDLAQIFGQHQDVDFFHLEPGYFPAITQDLFKPEELLLYGALPLGFKTEAKFFRSRKVLNLGLLNPEEKESIQALTQIAHQKLGPKAFHEAKVFLILSDQFIDILLHVYGWDESRIRSMKPGELNETLSLAFDESAQSSS